MFSINDYYIFCKESNWRLVWQILIIFQIKYKQMQESQVSYRNYAKLMKKIKHLIKIMIKKQHQTQ